jgi:hypothetical protein
VVFTIEEILMRYHNFQTEDRVENKGGAKLLVCLLTIISLTLLLAGCQGNNLQKDSLTEIKIAILQVYSTGLMVAADRSDTIDPGTNCFTKAGLKPILIKRSKGPEVVDALLGGSAEVGTLAVRGYLETPKCGIFRQVCVASSESLQYE